MAREDRSRNWLSDQRLPGETALGHFLRWTVIAMLLCLPQMMTPFIIYGSLQGASDPPPTMIAQLEKAEQIYCARHGKRWNPPWWRDPKDICR